MESLVKCTRCEIERPITDFSIIPESPRYQNPTGKRYSHCNQCRRLFPKYGINYADYLKMFAAQNGLCKICEKPETALKMFSHTTPKALAVDHDPNTGKVRGLLCQKCNTGIGNLMHDTDLLRMAIKYLEETA